MLISNGISGYRTISHKCCEDRERWTCRQQRGHWYMVHVGRKPYQKCWFHFNTTLADRDNWTPPAYAVKNRRVHSPDPGDTGRSHGKMLWRRTLVWESHWDSESIMNLHPCPERPLYLWMLLGTSRSPQTVPAPRKLWKPSFGEFPDLSQWTCHAWYVFAKWIWA